jgi:dimethylamine monooxygenase subunit A
VVGGLNVNRVDWLTPAERMPWPVAAPFRMRPNLEKLDTVSPALLLRDELADVYRRERERVIEAHRERAIVGTANDAVIAAIGGVAPSVSESTVWPPLPGGEGWGEGDGARSNLGWNTHTLSPNPSPPGGGEQNVLLHIQEDFVILKQHEDTLRTEYLSVCFPSRWDPREKLGLDFASIHAPVADNQMLQAAGANIMVMAFMKAPMLRHVWLIVPGAGLDQHPQKNQAWWREALADPSPLLPRLFFRIERQTTWPLPHLQRAVFFIRVMMSSLVDVLSVRAEPVEAPAPGRAAELAATLRSMTPAIVAYRGMTEAMPRLLAELDQIA